MEPMPATSASAEPTSSGTSARSRLFVPALLVHAEDEKPEDPKAHADDTDEESVLPQPVPERRPEVRKPGEPADDRQHAKNPRKERGPQHEPTGEQRLEAKEGHRDPGGMVIHEEQDQRQVVQGLGAERVKASASEQVQGGREQDATARLDAVGNHAQAQGDQREAPTRRFEE